MPLAHNFVRENESLVDKLGWIGTVSNYVKMHSGKSVIGSAIMENQHGKNMNHFSSMFHEECLKK